MSGGWNDPIFWFFVLLVPWCVLGVFAARKASARWGDRSVVRRIILAIGWYPLLALISSAALFLRLWLHNGNLPERRFRMGIVDDQLAYIADTSAAGFEVHDNLSVFLMYSALFLLPLLSPVLLGFAWERKRLRRPSMLFAYSYAICLLIVIFEPSGTMDWLLFN